MFVLDSNAKIRDNLSWIFDIQPFAFFPLSAPGRRSVNEQPWGYDLGLSETVGSTKINDYMCMFNSWNFVQSITTESRQEAPEFSVTTYNGSAPQFRIASFAEWKTGGVLNWLVVPIKVTELWTGITWNLKIRLSKMNTSWTLSQVWEYVYAIPDGINANNYFIAKVPSTTPQTLNAWDRVIVDIEIADLTWTHNTSNYYIVYFNKWFWVY